MTEHQRGENNSVRVHRLKTWPSAWWAVRRGEKTFDYRRNDRDFAVHDVVILEEWDPAHNERIDPIRGHSATGGYTGRKLSARVTYMLQGQYGVPEGFAVLALCDVEVVK